MLLDWYEMPVCRRFVAVLLGGSHRSLNVGCGSLAKFRHQAPPKNPQKFCPASPLNNAGSDKQHSDDGSGGVRGGEVILTFSNFSMVRLSMPPHL